jgi:hypothetical protein
MAKKQNEKPPVDYEAFFPVPLPTDLLYMPNVLLTFVHAIPEECYEHCKSEKHSGANPVTLAFGERQAHLRDFVEERLGKLADYEYRQWINGLQPFVTPRELQIWRLKMYMQYIWFWSLPDDEDLALIFNLTKRRAANLAADFFARFRKTMVYPVALRRLYFLINTTEPETTEAHPKVSATGLIYRIPSSRFVNVAQYLVEDIRAHLPALHMQNPYLWDKEQYRMWIDKVTVDVMKSNDQLRTQFYSMYKIPTA